MAVVGVMGVLLGGLGAPSAETRQMLRPDLRVTSARFAAGQATSVQSPAPDEQRAVLKRYCVTCHNQTSRTADLSLDNLNLEHVGQAAEAWEKVVRKLRTGAMPPPGAPRPDQMTYDRLAAWLERELDQ